MYTKNIIEIWSTDSVQENTNDSNNKILIQFLSGTKESIDQILKKLTNINYDNNKENTLNYFYTSNRNILGFSKILKLKKLEHNCLILDFIFDYSRQTGTLDSHSMNYLAKIILETNLKMINDFIEHRKTSIDISTIVEESKVYLFSVLDQTIKKNETSNKKEETRKVEVNIPSNPTPVEMTSRESDYQKIKKETTIEEPKKETMTNSPVTVPVNTEDTFTPYPEDSPEEINIPPDKIGLISDFYEEAYQNLSSMGRLLIDLENSPESIDIVNTLFRAMHTVKGGSRLLKINRMEALAHSLENMLDLIRNKSLTVNSGVIDILLDGKEFLVEILEEVASKAPIQKKINPLLKRIDSTLKGKGPNVESISNTSSEISKPLEKSNIEIEKKVEISKPTEIKTTSGSVEKIATESKEPILKIKNKHNEFIRVSTEKLDDVINTASELSVTRILFQDEISHIHRLIRDIKKVLPRIEEADYTRVLNRVSQANDQLISELEEYYSMHKISYDKPLIENIVKRFYNELKSEVSRSELSISEEMTLLLIAANELKNSTLKNVENLELLTTRLQSGVMNFRMIPLNSLFERFPSTVRDVARQIGKKVRLDISGGDTELDRAIINQLSDPLLHILRNSVDHGIELPDERKEKNKNETGVISLRSYYQGSNAIIEIKDDGKGINKDAVLQKAIERNIVSFEDSLNLSDKQIFEFIFAPGFSTASSVTELSGRGVGMDVVMSAIKELQGSVDINSIPNQGTVISLKIPLTLAIVRVLLFELSGRLLALPMANILEILRISKSDIQFISNRFIYELNGEIIHLVYLSKVLEINSSSTLPDEIPLLILEEGNRKIGLIVETLHGRQEIVIKNLGNLLKKVPLVMGCAILSDRKLVLVLNPRDILDACFEENSNLHTIEIGKSNKNIHNILVVDDSAVHRQNVRMILTRAGYNVDESENGFEALKMVRLKKYTILCVDVVMPLMDGIELTRRLRNLPLYRSIPILLITSKQAREDRERGIKSGANEYFEKPIDPDVLLNAINRYTKDKELENK
jgi:two-component system, chemotaxis family, sensor kinase CheA